jgi:hypothetical protein
VRQKATETLTRRNREMNRSKFWKLWIASGLVAAGLDAVMKMSNIPPIDGLILGLGSLGIAAWSVHLIYLRAVDVGYVKPGWMTLGVLIPFFGIGVFWTIATLKTGERTGCTLPCLPSTQKKWAQQRQAQQAASAIDWSAIAAE